MASFLYEVVEDDRAHAFVQPRLHGELVRLGFVEVGRLRARLTGQGAEGGDRRRGGSALSLPRPVLAAPDGTAFVTLDVWGDMPVMLFRTVLRGGTLVETLAHHAREGEESFASLALLRGTGVPVDADKRDRQVLRVPGVRQAWQAHQARVAGSIARWHAPVLAHRDVGQAVAVANAAEAHELRVVGVTRVALHVTRLLPVLALAAALLMTAGSLPLAAVVLTGAGAYALTSLVCGRLVRLVPRVRWLRPAFSMRWPSGEEARSSA